MRFEASVSSVQDRRVTVSAIFLYSCNKYSGSGCILKCHTGETKCIAQATINAVSSLLNDERKFTLFQVKIFYMILIGTHHEEAFPAAGFHSSLHIQFMNTNSYLTSSYALNFIYHTFNCSQLTECLSNTRSD